MKKKLIGLAMATALTIGTATATAGTAYLLKPIGTFEITAYSYHEGGGENYKTASQRTPEPFYSVATDPSVIPLGTYLYIEGIGEVRADDTGGAVKGNVIDLHVGYSETDSFGRQNKEVYIIPK